MNRPTLPALIVLAVALAACTPPSTQTPAPPSTADGASAETQPTGTQLAPEPSEGLAQATLAGGCFWCMEGPFDQLEGVSLVLSGYTGGTESSPRYEDVARGRTGHVEAVRIHFDPDRLSYPDLLDVYWRQIDPTDNRGQFADRGHQYRPLIFVHDANQQHQAEESRAAIAASGRFNDEIRVDILDALPFWVAEDVHQGYYRTNPEHYARYRRASGREAFLRRVWGE